MPRKSDIGPIPGAGPPPGEKDANGSSIDDNVLPKSIVTRLSKGVLPQNTNIQKDAVLALTKGATVFINYLCATGNENAVKSNRKTIMPKDVLEAISQLELDEFRPRLEAELAKFEEITSEKRAASKKAAKDKESKGLSEGSPSGKTSLAHGASNEEGADEEGEIDTSPPAKKRKANGRANGSHVPPKPKKPATYGMKAEPEMDEHEEELGEEDKGDFLEDDEEEEIYDEEEGEEIPDTVGEDAVDDLDEAEPRQDEAFDDGYDSD